MGGKIRKKIIGWDEAPSQEYFSELFRVSRHQIIWGANYFQGLPPTRCFLVWRKLTISESFSMAMCEYAWTSFATNAKVFECAPQGGGKNKRFHPTQKPVSLYAWILKNYANPGDKYKMGFDFYATEIDKEYFDAQEERFRRECLEEEKLPDGRIAKQLTIYEMMQD